MIYHRVGRAMSRIGKDFEGDDVKDTIIHCEILGAYGDIVIQVTDLGLELHLHSGGLTAYLLYPVYLCDTPP